MSRAPVATGYTFAFVRRYLPDDARDILEIGCGSGELAARLLQDGMRIVALDSDANCVAEARVAGVDARIASWPTDMDEKFDAVLFTRSLHHIHPLDEAAAAAARVLRPGGAILVEDFRAEGGSERSNTWFAGTVRLLEAAGAFGSGFDLDATLSRTERDDHDLHSSSAIGGVLRRLGSVQAEDAAYYFRYLEGDLPAEATAALLDHEVSLTGAGVIDPLGKRFVLYPD